MSPILFSEPTPYIALITLNRPEAANALNTELATALNQALRTLKASRQMRALVITGAGERVFCAGADLKERVGMDRAAWEAQHHAFESAFEALSELEIPIIAAVNGAAYAGGLELALACDLIVSSPNAIFAFTEATLGIMPGLGGTARLPRAIGQRAALEMLLTSEPINAERAYTLGLINRISADASAVHEALTMAEKIAVAAPLSIRSIKQSIYRGADIPLTESLRLELDFYATLIDTKDRTEGIQAFKEKRKAVFVGE